jgi:GTP:adenosylcobinamide-phosphate guanylyltransferase
MNTEGWEKQELRTASVSPPFPVFLLAGRRGPIDPVAQYAGVSHKILVPVAGVPMIVHVVRSLRAVPRIKRIVISLDDPTILDGLAEIRMLADAGVLSVHHTQGRSPSESVLQYFNSQAVHEPLIITTADHPLLTAEMAEHFCAAVAASEADVVVGVVAKSFFRARYPESKRSFIPLRGESFCGTNLFALRTPRAAAAAAFWNHAGQFRKRPWRLISTFGLTTLVLLALRRLDLAVAIPRVARVLGVSIDVVQMPFAECAIDVDNLNDLETASRILVQREETSGSDRSF